MARAKFDSPTMTTNKANPEEVGGGEWVEKRFYTPDGQYHITGEQKDSGELNRYRGMGEAAAQRQAYNVDFSKAQADEARGLQSRERQMQALGLQQQAAHGNAPSRAAIMGQQAAGQSLEATMAGSAGARSMGGMAAQMQAQRGQGGMQQQAVGQLAGMRANEMNDARSQYGAGAGSVRAGDYTQQGMAQQRAEAQAQSEMAQRKLNQGAQMGYEQMGINHTQATSDGDLRQMQAAKTEYDTQAAAGQAASDAKTAQNMAIWNGTGGTLASLVGADMKYDTSGSDERMKADVVPLVNERDAGVEQHYDREVKPAEVPAGPLSAPTPRYSSMGEAAAARPAAAPQAAKPKAVGAPRKMSDAELKRLGEEMLASQGAKTKASLDAGPAVRDKGDPMGDALANGLKPFEYEYKPSFRNAEQQAGGEKNVGPMAQDMASNPVTGTAVKRGSDGLLYIDQPKALKLSLGGIGYLAAKQREQEAEIARLKGRG